MSRNLLAQAIQKYGLDVLKVQNSENGYRNTNFPLLLSSGETVNLIVYKAEPHILKKVIIANKVSDYLAGHGLPTRRTIGRILQISSPRLTKYACLYTYLPGATIPWEAYTMDHLKLLGKSMSDMHAMLKSAAIHGVPSVTEQCTDLLDRMQFYLSDPNVTDALKLKQELTIDISIFKKFTKVLERTESLQEQQVLHMDFVRGNILFTREASGSLKYSISGILDFEKASHGHAVFDVARTLAFLLVDCKFKTDAKIRKYFLKSGYNKRGTSDFAGFEDILENLIDFYLLHDFYKFLKYNPYEFLSENEHFIRTRNLLLERKMLK